MEVFNTNNFMIKIYVRNYLNSELMNSHKIKKNMQINPNLNFRMDL